MTDILDDIIDQPRLMALALQGHLAPDSALNRAVQAILQQRPRRIVLTGMGSSLFAAYPAYLRLLNAGLAVTWIELSELLHYASGQVGADTLLVVVSQSGETVEALRLLESHQPAALLAVTNNAEGTLAKRAQWVVMTGAGPEATVATKTYSTALLALSILAARLTGATPHELGERITPAIDAAADVVVAAQAAVAALPAEWRGASPITLVGRGPALATALSGGLLIKETAKVAAEGMSSAQFRHGPLEISGPGHRAIICAAPGPTLALDQKLAGELRRNGSQVLLIGPPIADADVTQIPLPETAYTELYALIPIQLLARALASQQGITPGSFRHIGKVTTDE